MPVIYADMVWLVNVVLDAVLLSTTCWLVKQPVKLWRIVAGATTGACYALLLFVPPLTFLTTWPGKALASLLIVKIGVPSRNWLQLLRACLAYYLVAFVMAGAAVALHFAIPGESVSSGVMTPGRGLEFATSAGSLALVVAVPSGIGLLKFVFRRVQRQRTTMERLYRVTVTIGDWRAEFTGLADTGNQLRDPLSRKPVCLVDAAVLSDLFPEPIRKRLTAGDDLLSALDLLTNSPLAARLSFVPFRGAGGGQQLALAVRPDLVEVEQDGQRRAASVPCLLAMHPEPLSLEGRFQSILHTEVLTGVDGFENHEIAKIPEHETAHSSAAAVDPHSHQAPWRS